MNDGISTSCAKTIANTLNRHFTSIGEKLANKLPNSKINPKSYLGEQNQNSMFLNEIELYEVLEEIQGIDDKKAMGHDNIPPKIIKWAPQIFAPILQSIFNKCLQIGLYPGDMKIARVVPIHKGGDVNDIKTIIGLYLY